MKIFTFRLSLSHGPMQVVRNRDLWARFGVGKDGNNYETIVVSETAAAGSESTA